MFTSRAEYRLLLRQDNADSRLMRKGYELGLIPSSVVETLDRKEKRVAEARRLLESERATPLEVAQISRGRWNDLPTENTPFAQLLRRPEVTLSDILELPRLMSDKRLEVLLSDRESREKVEIETKYEGYLKRQEEQVRQFEKNEDVVDSQWVRLLRCEVIEQRREGEAPEDKAPLPRTGVQDQWSDPGGPISTDGDSDAVNVPRGTLKINKPHYDSRPLADRLFSAALSHLS